jgi:hypothetical protein
MARHSAAHPGFKAAILAAAARKASPAARKKNPRLNKVGGMPKLKRVKA